MADICAVLGCNENPEYIVNHHYDKKITVKFLACDRHKDVIENYRDIEMTFEHLD